MSATKTFATAAARFSDHDDCLAAALDELRALTGMPSWRGEASWQDDDREVIVVTDVPDGITATVNGTAGKRATPMSTRLAQWTLEQVNELDKIEREASVTASAEDGTDDSNELGDLLRLAQ